LQSALANASSLLGGGRVCPTQANHVRAGQALGRLAEHAAGEYMVETEGRERIQQDDVQIATQSTMLESVVEKNHVATVIVDGLAGSRKAIGVLHVGNVGQSPAELAGLVVGMFAGGAVAATNNGGLQPLRGERAGQPLYQRGFAGAAESQIPDADDGHRNTMNVRLAAVESPVPPADFPRIWRFGQSQDRPSGSRQNARPLSAD
jgi:hypothetical protein